MSRAQIHVAVVCGIGLLSLSKVVYNHVSTMSTHRVVSSIQQTASLSPSTETVIKPDVDHAGHTSKPGYLWLFIMYIFYTLVIFAALLSLYHIVWSPAESMKTQLTNVLSLCGRVLSQWISTSKPRKGSDVDWLELNAKNRAHSEQMAPPPVSLLSRITSITFSKDFNFTVIDIVLFVYFVHCSQYLIALLFLVIIGLNVWRVSSSYLGNLFRVLSTFDIVLFHTTFQLLPLSFSIAFYGTNNRYIDLVFAFVLCSFIYTLYNESEKLSRDSDNNTKMLKIICLCVILDYIHVIMLILCRLYLTNSFYFYKFMLIESFAVILYWCIVYSEGFVYRGPAYYFRNLRFKDIWSFFWFTMFLHFGIPIFMECCNASWIIFVYEQFLSKLRADHSKRFAETLRDELVQWLETDKQDVLMKICCVNHIKLANSKHEEAPIIQLRPHYDNAKRLQLLRYLEEHMQCHQNYYRDVEWNKVVYHRDEDVFAELKKMIMRFYSPMNQLNSVYRAINDYQQHRNFRNFHKVLTAIGGCLMIAYLVFYFVLKLFHIFVLPLYTVWVMDEVMNIYQGCFILMYFVLEAVIVYKLYELLNYEKIMWYALPNLEHLNLTETDIQTFKQYYAYIKVGRFDIEAALAETLGLDVAKLVMLYVPDFIELYKEKQQL